MIHRAGLSRSVHLLAVFGLVLTLALSTPLLGQSADAARRGYDGPANPSNAEVGTLTITWDFAIAQDCNAYATLTGWAPNTTYTVEYSYVTPIRPVSGSRQLTTDANGAAFGRITSISRRFLATFSVNGVTAIGFPGC